MAVASFTAASCPRDVPPNSTPRRPTLARAVVAYLDTHDVHEPTAGALEELRRLARGHQYLLTLDRLRRLCEDDEDPNKAAEPRGDKRGGHDEDTEPVSTAILRQATAAERRREASARAESAVGIVEWRPLYTALRQCICSGDGEGTTPTTLERLVDTAAHPRDWPAAVDDLRHRMTNQGVPLPIFPRSTLDPPTPPRTSCASSFPTTTVRTIGTRSSCCWRCRVRWIRSSQRGCGGYCWTSTAGQADI